MFEVIAEQNGIPESKLKADIQRALHDLGTVQRAYLAFVRHDFPPTPAPNGTVALCLLFRPGVQPGRTVAHCLAVFKRMFNTEQSLDIIPINEDLEACLLEFSTPFFNE